MDNRRHNKAIENNKDRREENMMEEMTLEQFEEAAEAVGHGTSETKLG